MGNAIQFGIYRISLIVSSLFIFTQSFSQDYYVDLKGDTQSVEISEWYFNHFYYQEDDQVAAKFCDEFSIVYRAESEVSYKPYSSFVDELDYVNFLLPSTESLKNLSTDYFEDEHVKVWITGTYIVYVTNNPNYNNANQIGAGYSPVSYPENYQEKFLDPNLFQSKDSNLREIPSGVVFIYEDSLGFSKIVADDMEQDYFELLFSRYSSNPSFNESIFNGDLKLKQKNFLKDFDKYIRPLTAVQFNDKDLAGYYINKLNDGALVLLLNLDLKKIKLYRDSGNDKLADELESKLLKDNLSYAIGFLEPALFNFCHVYVTDAKNRANLLQGVRENIFLNINLELDSSIVLEEDFFLFARKGQVFETQALYQDNQKKKVMTSAPVVQDALVIYDHNNVQLMAPFPFYIREGTALISANKDMESGKVDISNYKALSSYLKDKYHVEDLEKSSLGVASSMNVQLHKFLENNVRFKSSSFERLKWSNYRIYENAVWQERPLNMVNPYRNQVIQAPNFSNF